VKCKNCNGCLKVIRVEREESFVFWYCYLCDRLYEFYNSKNEVEDLELKSLARENYKKLFKGFE